MSIERIEFEYKATKINKRDAEQEVETQIARVLCFFGVFEEVFFGFFGYFCYNYTGGVYFSHNRARSSVIGGLRKLRSNEAGFGGNQVLTNADSTRNRFLIAGAP